MWNQRNEKKTEKYERFPMAQNIQGLSALTKVTKSLPHFSFRMKYKLQTQNIDQTSASNSLLN